MRQPEWSPGWLARVRPSLPLHLEAALLWRARCRVEAIEPARAGKLSPRHDGGPDSSGPRRRRRGGWTAPVTRMLGIRLPVVGSVLQVVVTESRPAVLPQLV